LAPSVRKCRLSLTVSGHASGFSFEVPGADALERPWRPGRPLDIRTETASACRTTAPC